MKMWIARDLDGSLALYEREPKLVVDQIWTGGCSIWISPKEYPEVTFENSPMEVELKLVNDVQGK